ncbi:MAG: thiol reductant ABC exporter subunit CydC [Parashewanella sp.]
MKRLKRDYQLIQLQPFVRLFKSQLFLITLGVLLNLATLFAGIALLGVSGWFLTATAIAGLTALGIKSFNFYTPAASVRFLAMLRTAGRYGERLVTHQATLKILTQIRIWLWQKLQPLSVSQLSRFKRGEVLNRLLTDIDILDQLYLRVMTPIISYFLLSLFLIIGVSFWQVELAINLGLVLCGLGISLPTFGYFFAKSPAVNVLNAKRVYRLSVLELLDCQMEFTLFGCFEQFKSSLAEFETQLYTTQLSLVKRNALLQSLLILSHGLLLIVTLYWLGRGYLGNHGADMAVTFSGAEMALVVFVVIAFMEVIMPLLTSSQQLSACVMAAGRINEITQQQPAVCYGSDKQSALTGQLSITNLHFGYDEKNVLSNVSLDVNAGEHIVVMGHSGCGKSSLLSLITRLQLPSSGMITLAGKPIEQYSEAALCKSITYIEQKPQIFSASLRDNLAIALADGVQVTDAELKSVLDDVELTYLLESQGLNLWIGDGGRQLSGGEKTRLSIARALLRNAPLVLLDEPTEGLDIETEQVIFELIFDVFKEKTLIMVSHRALPSQQGVRCFNMSC